MKKPIEKLEQMKNSGYIPKKENKPLMVPKLVLPDKKSKYQKNKEKMNKYIQA